MKRILSILVALAIVVAGGWAIAQDTAREFPDYQTEMRGGQDGMIGQGEMMGQGAMPGRGGMMDPGQARGGGNFMANPCQGMMGQGGMMGAHGMMGQNLAALADHPLVPEAKRDEIRRIGGELTAAIQPQMAAMRATHLGLMQAIHSAPLDTDAAQARWQAMQAMMGEVFRLRREAMAQAHDLLGEELWQQMHAEGAGNQPCRGPGGMMGRDPSVTQ